jgi:alpha-amylase
MPSVCLYFQVHQPCRLRPYSVFDIGNKHDYFDEGSNEHLCKLVAERCYIPANDLMLKLIRDMEGKFKISYSISGVALDQLALYVPEVIESFQKLGDTGAVEFLSETHYHSICYLYNKDEFVEQVEKHKRKIKALFGQSPKVLRNTELIYDNDLARLAEDMGYMGILAEGAEAILGWRSPNYVYKPIGTEKVKLLLRNYKLSDDVSFRFSERNWDKWPLTASKFARWIDAVNGAGDVVNLFMDYETFGEHQSKDTGIFQFLGQLPEEILAHPDNDFKTITEAIMDYKSVAELDVPNVVSWADVARDASAWLGNTMQRNAADQLFLLADKLKDCHDQQLLEDWRRLQTSDHFYYMCNKWFADGDIHSYFNPHGSPYDAFIAFMNILNDVMQRVDQQSAISSQRSVKSKLEDDSRQLT